MNAFIFKTYEFMVFYVNVEIYIKFFERGDEKKVPLWIILLTDPKSLPCAEIICGDCERILLRSTIEEINEYVRFSCPLC